MDTQSTSAAFGRRDFLLGGLAAAGLSVAGETAGLPTVGETAGLRGVCDIHAHAAPDTRPRLGDEADFALAMRAAGYRAVLFKSNVWSNHDRAWLTRRLVPGIEVFGGLCLNGATGPALNAGAVEAALATEGGLCRCVWLPTLDAAYPRALEGVGGGIPVTENGRLLPAVTRIMERCAEAGIALASGHSSPEETLSLAARAREVGLERFVVTHANASIWRLSADQIRRAVDFGAWVEFCFLPCLWGPGTALARHERQPTETFAALCALAPERAFVSTDLGQAAMPHPVEGMRRARAALEAGGLDGRAIDLLLRWNPARVIGLDNDRKGTLT